VDGTPGSRRATASAWLGRHALVDREAALIIATELESSVRRVEQLIRWSRAKADALASNPGWPFGIQGQPTVERLLVLRDVRSNREIAAQFATTFRAAYPADAWQALASIQEAVAWPGSAVLWAADVRDGGIKLHAAPTGRGGTDSRAVSWRGELALRSDAEPSP
jgi:hypothetical protein